MAQARKASAYSKHRVVPYTRKSKKRSKSYIKTVPNKKLVKFQMGNSDLYRQGKLSYEVSLVSKEDVQIRDFALEACRQYINKKLEAQLAKQYFFQVKVHPHHIQRENRMLTGAGADRMQTGMQLSFGKTMNLAAIVKKGKEIFTIAVVDEKGEKIAREILKKIKPKLPCKTGFVTKVLEKK